MLLAVRRMSEKFCQWGKLMLSKPNRSTPDYLFEKAEQYFRRSRIDSNVRVELEALGNAFMVKAVELDIKLQKLAKGNYTALSPHGLDN
jgi:hypothetical protein